MGPPNGPVYHAEIVLGDSQVWLSDQKAPKKKDGTIQEFQCGVRSSLAFYLPDVDEAFKTAIDAGCVEVYAIEDKFYGDRSGTLNDPFGHQWTLMTHVKDVTEEEMAEFMNKKPEPDSISDFGAAKEDKEIGGMAAEKKEEAS